MTTISQRLVAVRGYLHNLFDRCFCKRWPDIEPLGHISTWYVQTSRLNSHSVVYSAGVGRDITFELALRKRFGCTIYLFDPSPTGVKTMAQAENQAQGIIFSPVGLAGESGPMEFGEPLDSEEGSFSIAAQSAKRIRLDCISVADFLCQRGHDHVDLLKMDIEGSEYAVIDSILRDRLRVRMICCEFHHFLPGYSRWTTLRSILKLRQHGYSLIHKDHHNYTFLFK